MIKRKKIILSSVALLISFAIMGFGVYAASNPTISISGQVTYTASNAKVLVQGKVQNAEDSVSATSIDSSTYKEPADKNNLKASDKLTNSRSQYLDYSFDTSSNNSSDTLSVWNLGSLRFVEDDTEIKNIIISFKLTNYSAYPVKAKVSFSGALDINLNRTSTKTESILSENYGTDEIIITYAVQNASGVVNSTNITMDIAFESGVIEVIEPTLEGWTTENDATLNGLVLKKYQGAEKKINIPNELNGQPVVKIGDSAFKDTQIESCIIPEGVTSIGASAFKNTLIKSCVIPEGVTSIGNSAFSLCSELTSIILPDSLRTLNYATFYRCFTLKTITLPKNLNELGGSVFYECFNLKTVTLPASLEKIGSGAFYKCASLTTINIPKLVKTIETSTFYGCTALESMTSSGVLKKIDSYAFKDCINLQILSLPDTLRNIDSSAFIGCSGLTSITIDENNTTYSDMNANVIYEKSRDEVILGCKNSVIPNTTEIIRNNAFNGCTGLTEITLPDTLKTIEYSAFYGCTGLTEITLPDSITSIEAYTFTYCTGLKEITLPASMTAIERGAFFGCTGLTTITANVTQINEEAFYGCTGLKTLILQSESLTIISYATFEGTVNAKFYVPDFLVDTYKRDSKWSQYASRIFSINALPAVKNNNY